MLIASGRREETPVVEVFEQRSMASPALAAVVVPGPSHETCLPRRPPCHWLRPPRESVVNALLPWHARTGRPTQFGARQLTRGPASKNDRDRPVRAQAKVVRDGPPQASGPNADIIMIQAHNLPLPSGWVTRVRRIDVPRKPSSGELGSLPIYRPQERRFGSDILWKTGRNRSARSSELGTRRSSPRRRGSSRAGFRVRTPNPFGRVRADRTGRVYLSLRSCVPS